MLDDHLMWFMISVHQGFVDFHLNTYTNLIYSCDAIITPVFRVTWSFRNHFNMLIFLSLSTLKTVVLLNMFVETMICICHHYPPLTLCAFLLQTSWRSLTSVWTSPSCTLWVIICWTHGLRSKRNTTMPCMSWLSGATASAMATPPSALLSKASGMTLRAWWVTKL